MAHIGIDIGTSNTVVAIVTDDGEPQVRQVNGEALVPSAIAVAERGGNVLAGIDAVNAWADPDRDEQDTFRRWKLLMGDDKVFRTMRFGGPSSTPVAITPEYLTTQLVEHVLSEVAGGIGGERVDSVLITVPHGWRRETPYKCQATRDAAARAKVGDTQITVQDKTISEPVAAAVYWLWEAQRASGAGTDSEFVGKHILVCDVGGGTLDLSLVKVGARDSAHVVVDAINNDYAGDYVTALLMAKAAGQFNAEFQTTLPTDADEILRQLGDAPSPGLRSWFVDLQRMQKDFSSVIAFAARSGREAPRHRKSVVLQESETSDDQITFSMTPAEFMETLEPFYARGRELVGAFVGQSGRPTPYAVVFAGGGSRIAGVAENVVAAALRDAYSVDVEQILDRLQINDAKIDQAIALGAALVAAGVVKVEERVLCDIGLEVSLAGDFAKELNVPAGDVVLMTPVIARGSTLPATFDSQTYKFFMSVPAGETLELKIVIDDDLADPYVLSWEEAIPVSASGNHQCSVVVSADADGILHVNLKYADGQQVNVHGKLNREQSGRRKIMISAQDPSAASGAYRSRFTPKQFAQAQTKLRTGGRG